MKKKIQYFIRQTEDGRLLDLGRVIEDDDGLWGESYDGGGRWSEDSVMTDFLIDPSFGDRIEEDEVEGIMRRIDAGAPPTGGHR